MAALTAALAALLHLALLAPAALLLAGFEAKLAGRLSGCGAPSLLSLFRGAVADFRRARIRPDGTPLAAAPLAAFAATFVGAALVPSFTPDLSPLPAGDLIGAVGLLALGRIAAALAAGTTQAPTAAEAVVLLAVLALASPGSGAALAPAMAALVVAALAAGPLPLAALAGPDLALLRAAAALRRLAWLSLVVDRLRPALPPGPLWWPAGLAVWAGGIAALALLSGLAAALLPPARPARRRAALAAAAALAATAVLVSLAEAAP